MGSLYYYVFMLVYNAFFETDKEEEVQSKKERSKKAK